ncbi:MAG: hypothetical protein WBN89_14335 [Prochlorococcaceae cyanobacterium]
MDDFNGLTDRIQCLGDQLEAAYHRCNYDDAALPALAADLLADFDAETEFDPRSIAAFFAQTRVRQQTDLRFSNLPVTLYRHREFYIEILVWSHASTAVHQHSFAGAFKVLQGSSLHTRFRFEQQRRLSADFLLGEVMPEYTEFLPLGAVRPILAGDGGLIHSLYHLEQPSMTLVVRSHGHDRHMPQYTFFRPCIALNPFYYERDDLLIMTSRLLNVARQVDPATMLPLWMDSVGRLDYPRLAYLLLTNSYPANHEADLQQVLEAARRLHGDLVDALDKSLRVQRKLETLSNCRKNLQDPDLRFLLALLMNATDREAVLRLLQQRHPDADPIHTCAELLARLSTSKTATKQILTQALDEVKIHALLLGNMLGVALPDDASLEDAELLYRQFLQDPEALQIPATCCHLDRQQVQAFLGRLVGLDVLECLR